MDLANLIRRNRVEGLAELGVVKEIKELRAEPDLTRIPTGRPEALGNGEIAIGIVGATHLIAARLTEAGCRSVIVVACKEARRASDFICGSSTAAVGMAADGCNLLCVERATVAAQSSGVAVSTTENGNPVLWKRVPENCQLSISGFGPP